MKLLVTGANGFIGKALVNELLASTNYKLNLVARNQSLKIDNQKLNYFYIKDIAMQDSWEQILEDCSVVIHTAARVHILQDNCTDPLAEFRKVNVTATMNLAKQAARQGVKRFIFLSSIGVHGSGGGDKPINEETTYNPQSPYAVSKLEVEEELFKLSQSTGMEIVVIRPPLVYSYDAPGNFGKLLRLISKKIFLPLGSINNQRSFISKENLVDFICCCIEHSMAKNQAFVIADEEPISTSDLIKFLRKGMNLSSFLIPVPPSVVRILFRMIGKEVVFQQLCGSLQVNISKAQDLLNWKPKHSLNENLLKVGANYKALLECQSKA